MMPSDSSAAVKRRWRRRTSLIWNHMDAWQVAMIIAALPLLLHDRISWHNLSLLLAIGIGYWFAFTLNDFFDAPHDALDPAKKKRNFFAGKQRDDSRRLLLYLFVPSALLDIIIFFTFGLPGILFMLLCLFIMWAYSAPPLRLESRAGLDIFTHAFFVQTFVYLLVMVLIRAPWTGLDFVIISILLLTSLTAQLEQQLRDFEVDAKTRRTIAFVWGRRWTRRVLIGVTAVIITAVSLFFILNDAIPLLLLPYTLISLPALVHRFTRSARTPRSEKLILLSTSAAFLYTLGLLAWRLHRELASSGISSWRLYEPFLF